MEARPKELVNYVDNAGREPFQDWLDNELDSKMRNIIQTRLIRVRLGNFGDCHGVGEAVPEFRIDVGPGYRVYFGQDGDSSGATHRRDEADTEQGYPYSKGFLERLQCLREQHPIVIAC